MDRPTDGEGSDPLMTVTHARLRVEQGDRRGARRILGGLLSRSPDHEAARRLLGRLGIPRLEDWLTRLERRGDGAAGEEPSMDAELERVRGAVRGLDAVLLVDGDGMIVTASPREESRSWEWAAAGYTEVLRGLGRTHRDAELEPPHELVVTGPRGTVVYRTVTEGYGLIGALAHDGDVPGKARFELRKTATKLRAELEG